VVRRWVSGLGPLATKGRAFTVAAVDTALVFLPSFKVFVPGAELWGQGVWGGIPGPAHVEETCRWAPMPGFNGPARP
jgi:hypothetical protein